MIRLADLDLPEPTANQLTAWQTAIDRLPAYPDKVEQAQRQFKLRNKAMDPTFRTIREHLDALCYGERRCTYCEDSCADEVEHVRPKALFPEQVFVWRNYVYACGSCNGLKLNNYPRLIGAVERNLARRRSDPIVPPPPGIDLLIDPRVENPAEYFVMDLRTGMIVPRGVLGGIPRQKAEQTLNVLQLNRALLQRARKQQVRNYVARLREYIRLRDEDECADAEAYAESICTMGHPMVWNEIRRHQANEPALHRLFVQAPEALTWEPQPKGLSV